MKKNLLCFFIPVLFYAKSFAQQAEQDTLSVKKLEDVVVKGYEQNRKLNETAGAVGVVNKQQLERYSTISVLPAINAVPGVRMEERSPGSYRLNIRGSSLRSPFGVRNVKVYLNGIPFSDPGGNTYLNQLSFYNFSSVEILKGPGSSLYGAGMGGVMLINSVPNTSNNQLSINYSRGSYNTNNVNISASGGSETYQNSISYTHQSSDGYREQSAMRRDIITWDSKITASKKQELSAHVLFGDLFYQTPGGLTKTQFLNNPKAARPAAGIFPGAIQNNASIQQKMFWAGVDHQYNFTEHFKNNTSVYGAFSKIDNPAIRNYEKRLEPNFGGRTTFSYNTNVKKAQLNLIAGAEFQKGYSTIKVYKNTSGKPDSLQTDDEVNNYQAIVFAQAELSFSKGWIATAGVSLNTSSIEFNRLSIVPSFNYKSHFNNQFSPRFSLLKKLNEKVSVYGVVSKGFSPPTVAELLPSTSVINTNLQAEKGNNFELGIRSYLISNRLFIDVNAFTFQLQNSISQRRDSSGADYFINAGKTQQKGIETALNYTISRNPNQFITNSGLQVSYSYHHFQYKQFKQLDADYSNNRIPGVAPHTVAALLNVETKPGIYVNANYFYSSKIALNDANADYASAYNLLGFKAGYKHVFNQHINAGFFVSGDNLLNETYSLGNDINAAANRFYNAAPGINFLAGISFQYVISPNKNL
ncbi:TonB-dependent receptor [Segetibacter koreensis]|uniref:TonB-dependent receptor n=1 Tax=Segetibacter koreensis TaxID=398037 RepID=UPI00037FD555|nr:TonB-dependent receptor [Segetibacter koreensis]